MDLLRGFRVPYRSFYRWLGGDNCSGMSYRPGGEYLLLLRRGEMDPYWTPLAPTSDQVRARARSSSRMTDPQQRVSHREAEGNGRNNRGVLSVLQFISVASV
jgi:hypothetical protein